LAFSSISRRKFLGLAAAGGIVTAVGVDSVLLEPNEPRVVQREIRLSRWPEKLDGFTIALLSDFHYDSHFSVHPIERSIPLVNSLKPDLIALTGDFVSVPLFSRDDKKAAAAAEPCANCLRKMHAPYGLWAVLGNHDFYSDPNHITRSLQDAGIHVLSNQSTAVELNGGRFWLSGVGDVTGGDADLDATLHRVPAGEATVLLAHEPDYADYASRHPIDLQLSGHSHGGQVRFPFIPPFYLPPLGEKYIWGLFNVGPLTLYTNPGLGTVGFPVRFNCPPEITFITLRRRTT
jgi:uncharacterized protein